MIHSMTAFARGEAEGDLGQIVWELRSVNHRYLEINPRLPDELRALEPALRERLGRRLNRGKVDVTLRYRPAAASDAPLRVNRHLAQRLVEAGNEIADLLHGAVPLRVMDLLRWPGVIELQEQDLAPLQDQALSVLDAALGELLETRRREGHHLAETIVERCTAMDGLVEQARARMPEVVAAVRERLRARLAELQAAVDQNRLEQELVLASQRLDVDEEMDRLRTHLGEVRRVLAEGGAVGRRLDFLMQELNREANTLGSKSADAETTRISVEMKVLIEQMREQVQNIE